MVGGASGLWCLCSGVEGSLSGVFWGAGVEMMTFAGLSYHRYRLRNRSRG